MDDVTVDLGGKTITCTDKNPWIGVDLTNRNGVVLQNGSVINCVRGVSIVGGGNHSLNKLTLKQTITTEPIIPPPVRYGLYVEGSKSNSFQSITAQFNTVGADITTSFDNWMVGLNLSQNKLNGLQFDLDATDNEIDNSVISGNGQFGVFYGVRAARNIVFNDQILNNGWVGLIPDSANVIESSTIKGNGNTLDTNAWLRGGIVPFGTNNLILNNDVSSNNTYGIATGAVPAASNGVANTIRWNNAGSNTAWDFADLTTGLCTDNDWSENTGVKIMDGCENAGGVAPDYHAIAAGKAGGMAFSFNAKRMKSGAASGRATLVNVPDASGKATNVKVEGNVTCLIVDPARPRAATLGLLVDKSSNTALVPLYSTFHLYMFDATPAVDQLGIARMNQFNPGYCPITTTQLPTITKGQVMVEVK